MEGSLHRHRLAGTCPRHGPFLESGSAVGLTRICQLSRAPASSPSRPPARPPTHPPTAQVRWITFHSGYDFGYLLKLLTCSSLPANESEFFQLLKVGRSFHTRALPAAQSWGVVVTCGMCWWFGAYPPRCRRAGASGLPARCRLARRRSRGRPAPVSCVPSSCPALQAHAGSPSAPFPPTPAAALLPPNLRHQVSDEGKPGGDAQWQRSMVLEARHRTPRDARGAGAACRPCPACQPTLRSPTHLGLCSFVTTCTAA
mgnify:CR=1 FL=1